MKHLVATLSLLALGALTAPGCVQSSTTSQTGADGTNGGSDGSSSSYTATTCKSECNNQLSNNCFTSQSEFETCYSLCNSGTSEEIEVYQNCLASSNCNIDCAGSSTIVAAVGAPDSDTCKDQCDGLNAQCGNIYTDDQVQECKVGCSTPLSFVVVECMEFEPCADLKACVEESPEFVGVFECISLCEELEDGGCLLDPTPCFGGCFFADTADDRQEFVQCATTAVGDAESCMQPNPAVSLCVATLAPEEPPVGPPGDGPGDQPGAP